jgi:hypothetical protein
MASGLRLARVCLLGGVGAIPGAVPAGGLSREAVIRPGNVRGSIRRGSIPRATYPPGQYPNGRGIPIPSKGSTKPDANAPMPNFRGNLKQMDDKNLTLELPDHRELQFKRNGKTKFFKGGDEVKSPKFAIGDQLSVEGPDGRPGVPDGGQRVLGERRRARRHFGFGRRQQGPRTQAG